jgi:hypothetical protein
MIIVLVLLALVAVAGLTLLVGGLIGYRVGSEPRCGFCGHDLSGRGTAGDCPECGRPLAGNIALGQRRIGRKRVILGAITLALALLVIGSAMSTGGILRRLPTAWLVTVHERIAWGGQRAALFTELMGRITNGTIRREQIDTLLARVIERQRTAALDRSSAEAANWSNQEADFVWAAAIAGLTNDAEFESFMVHAVDVGIEFEPTLEPGTVRPRFRITAPRGFTLPGTAALPQSVQVRVDELVFGEYAMPWGYDLTGGVFAGGSSAMGPSELKLDLPRDGGGSLPVTGAVTVRLGGTERRFTATARAPILREAASVDRAALASRLVRCIVITAVKISPTEIELTMQSEAEGLDLAEPPLLLGSGEPIVCGGWSRSGGEAERGRWKLTYDTLDPEHLGEDAGAVDGEMRPATGPLRFRFTSLRILTPIEDGFVGRVTIPATDVTIARPAPTS